MGPKPPRAPTLDMPAAVAHLRAADARLRRLIDRVGPLAPDRRGGEAFDTLAKAIVHQQLSTKAAETIWARVVGLWPDPEGLTPARAARAREERLRGAGLSRAKVAALKDLADKALSGELPRVRDMTHMGDEALIETLTAVRGIGRWSAEMFLIFRLARPDVLPLDDLGLRKAHGLLLRKDVPSDRKAFAAHGARWAPHRTAAALYLWRSLEA